MISVTIGFRNDGIAQPNKFEVILSCPTELEVHKEVVASLNNISLLRKSKQ